MPYIRKIKNIEVNPPQNNALGTTVSGTTSETITQTVTIPANTFKLYDIFGVETRVRKQNTNGTAIVRLRCGTGTTIGTTTQFAIFSGGTTSLLHQITRRAVIKSLTADTTVVSSTANLASDIFMDTQGYSNLAIDWTQTNYMLVTIQLSSTLDIANSTSLIIDCPQGEL